MALAQARAAATPAAVASAGAAASAASGGSSSSSSPAFAAAPAAARGGAEAAPAAKRPRTAAEDMPPPPAPAARDMPPPPVPAAKASKAAEASGVVAVKVEAPSGATPGTSLVDYSDDAVSVAASEDEPPAKDIPKGEGAAEEDAGPSLPEGFFDDPDLDAKVRGAEAPSIKAQRELEEGLKRFEKEIVVEVEKAEEARHDIDEEKYERVFAEEQEFQSSLQGRLEKLRKIAAEKLSQRKSESGTAAAAAAAADDAEDAGASGGEDSGSDVEFDWRAKGFG